MKHLGLVVIAACTTQPAPVTVDSVEDLGTMPLPSDGVGRDGGNSGALGGQVLWTFGDTFLSHANAIDGSSVLSATAGWSTPAAPLELAQAEDNGETAQLIPYTSAEIAANQADALNGYALWPGALIPLDATTGLVPFQLITRGGGSGFGSIGIGFARIHAGESVATRDATLAFAAGDSLYEPQFAHDGFVYAWACNNVGFLDFRCKLARAPMSLASWQYYDGSAWQDDIASAAYVLDKTAGGPTVTFSEHLGRYLAVTCDIVSSTVRIRTADAIEGPWDDGTTIEAGATGILAPTHDYNYLCVNHPELADGDSITISYSRPTDPFRGDVRLARIALH